MKEVTSREWAEFLCKHKCYATEGPKEFSSDKDRPLDHYSIRGYDLKGNIIRGTHIARVRYIDNINKAYYINTTYDNTKD